MVDFFSRLIGPFPYDRLSHVESTTIFGGMENPTAIFYDTKAYAARRLQEETVAHETAHQWFGDAVTEDDWHHLWLSEGFATYFAALWVRHAEGDSAFAALLRKDREGVIASPVTERPIIDPAATNLMGLLNSNNYPKGALVLHALRGLIGDSAFVSGIREWYRTYRDSTALSSDFAAVMSRAAGQDLRWYFTQALTQPGYPRLELRWRHTRRKLTVTIRETQPAGWGRYRLPGLILEIDGRRVPVDVTGAETVLTLNDVPEAPRQIVVDPDGWWLLQANVVEER
jgi:aminopeptidase N